MGVVGRSSSNIGIHVDWSLVLRGAALDLLVVMVALSVGELVMH